METDILTNLFQNFHSVELVQIFTNQLSYHEDLKQSQGLNVGIRRG